jgi:predicted transcriptional regulator of viral defense system
MLMRHEGRPYYVGLLKAAELHGATHQAVMEFQVITNRQLPKIRAGRSWITFHFRKDISGASAGIVERKTDTGSMKISSPELTALDLLRYMPVVGGIDAVATILAELGESLDSAKLADLAPSFERAPVQRLGYLLDHLGHGDKSAVLHDVLFKKRTPPWTSLEPEKRGIEHKDATPAERSERWHVRVRRNPDIDE